jgi:hypothetical protein
VPRRCMLFAEMSSPLHHYIPQFLLRRFGRGKTHQIHVFDKRTGKSFSGATNKLAAERKLYDFDFKGFPLTLEPSLAGLESETARCVEAILGRRRLAVKEPEIVEERGTLIRFIAVQMVRTAGAFAKANDLTQKLKVIAQDLGAPEDYFKLPPELGNQENAMKAEFARRIRTANGHLGPALLSKDWLLMRTDLKHPFLLGDHPVVLYNYFGGKLGVGMPGIVVYFPLSPEFALGLHCPSIAGEVRRQQQRLHSLPDKAFVANPDFYACFKEIVDIMEGFAKGVPIAAQPENVEHFNSIQVSNAERFVFSCDGNFELVEDMLRTDPGLKNGPRVEIKRGL